MVGAKSAERSGAGGQNPQQFRDFGQTIPCSCFLKKNKNLQGSGTVLVGISYFVSRTVSPFNIIVSVFLLLWIITVIL